MNHRIVYPFSAIVGQELMKTALLANAINPALGGVLIRGEKGTAKSTAARALASLLPPIAVVDGCPFHCHPTLPALMCPACQTHVQQEARLPAIEHPMPVVDLPLGATEDRLVGTLDIEKAIKRGERHFEPGLLAAAHQGILYVDEVNLLDNHLVDVLLDAAAMGVNVVEREGVSVVHPARFILIGTMNPEEGELRPQFLDRFGLCVTVEGLADPAQRMEVVLRRMAFDEDYEAFCDRWREQDAAVAAHIVEARASLPQVQCSPAMMELAITLAVRLGVQGHRADLALIKTARTLAAYDKRNEVTQDDIRAAMALVLPHRMRRSPFEEPRVPQEQMEQVIEEFNAQRQSESQMNMPPETSDASSADAPADDGAAEQRFHADTQVRLTPVFFDGQPLGSTTAGKHGTNCQSAHAGRRIGTALPQDANVSTHDIAFDATLRAAAMRQHGREQRDTALVVDDRDLRVKVREQQVGTTILFVVDSSGSMGAEQRMTAAKGAVLSLLTQAYQRRDRVGLIVCKGKAAELVLPPTASVEMARKRLDEVPTGGHTPLAHGLRLARDTFRQANAASGAWLVVISDGRANVAVTPGSDPVDDACREAASLARDGVKSVILDTEAGPIRLGMMQSLAEALHGQYHQLDAISTEAVTGVIENAVMGR